MAEGGATQPQILHLIVVGQAGVVRAVKVLHSPVRPITFLHQIGNKAGTLVHRYHLVSRRQSVQRKSGGSQALEITVYPDKAAPVQRHIKTGRVAGIGWNIVERREGPIYAAGDAHQWNPV